MGYGMSGHAMWDFQDSFGTVKVSSLEAFPFLNESLNHSIESLRERGMYGRVAASPLHLGREEIRGNLEIEGHPTAMGLALKAALGQVTTTSDTNQQIHVFQPNDGVFDAKAALPPVTLEINRDVGSAWQYFDMLCNDLRISIAHGEILSLQMGLMGAGERRNSAGSPTYVKAKPFQWSQFSGSLDGVAFADLRRLEIRHDNQLEMVHTLVDSRVPYRIARSNHHMIDIQGEAVFLVHSHYELFLAGSEFAFVGFFAGAETPNSFKFDFPAFRFKSFQPALPGPGLVHAQFTGEAMYHTGSAVAAEYTLVNTRTFY